MLLLQRVDLHTACCMESLLAQALVFPTFSMSFGFLEAFEGTVNVPKAWAGWN